MNRRQSSVAETRRRIVEATLELHGRNGIFGTSWQDIARSADVSLGTVYKHFPSLDELVPACGDLLMTRIKPPHPDQAVTIVGDASNMRERLRRVAHELFAFYERGGTNLESDLRERQLPAMQEWEGYLRDTVAAFLREALRGRGVRKGEVDRLAFALDRASFSAMRERGIGAAAGADLAADMIAAWVEARPAEKAVQSRSTRRTS